MNATEIQSYKQAGKIAKQVVDYAKSIIRPGVKLLDIAEKIENKIRELGGNLAFPVSLAIDDTAAHYTPTYNDETLATGLLKVDLGVSINGYIADMAFSLDLANSPENKKLIQASEAALQAALSIVKPGIELKEIGKTIQETITKQGFSAIRNLSGHELGKNLIHAGLTIPNVDNGSNINLPQGAFAIEPFSTTGSGIVYDGKPSGIYKLEQRKAIRDNLAREILTYIEKEHGTLPFSQREIIKKFSTRALFSLSLLEKQGILKQYPQLIEKSHKPVAQAEHTILVSDKVEVITR